MFFAASVLRFLGENHIHQEAGLCTGIDIEIARQSPDVVRKNMGHFTAFLPVPAGVRHASVPQMGAPCVQRGLRASLIPSDLAPVACAEEKA